MLKQERVYYVYVLFDRDGYPFYVGKGKKNRYKEHLTEARKLRSEKDRLIAEMLVHGQEIPCVKVAVDLSEEEAYALEEVYVDTIGRAPDGPLLNRCRGGYGSSGWKMKPNHLATLVAFHTGRKRSEETKRAISDAIKGTKRTPEQIEAMRQARLGRKLSEEHKAKIGETQRGRRITEQHRQALIASNVRRGKRHRGELLN